MNQEKIHVYFVPGLAAGKEIFENISLPKEQYKIHILEWLIPTVKESIEEYAARMASRIKHNNSVLVGVSFGGVMVQEMSAYLSLRKLIIISSVKCRNELPARLKIAKKTRAYKLIPTSLVLSTDDLTKYAIGPKSKKRLSLYNTYLHVRNKKYLDWAIENMVCWKREKPLEKVIHIHGDSDIVFPIKNIKKPILLEGGTHIMILNKGRWISEKLIEIIEDN